MRDVEGTDETELATLLAQAEELRRAGRTGEAVAVLEDVVAEYSAAAGRDTSTTLMLRNILAGAWAEDIPNPDRVESAKALVSDCERVLGEDHRITVDARGHLAGLFGSCGDLDAALAEYGRAVEDARRALGDGHSLTRRLLTNRAAALLNSGCPSEAIDDLGRVLGAGDPSGSDGGRDALAARHVLARCYLAEGRSSEARALLEHLVLDCARVFGHDAGFTKRVSNLLDYVRSYHGPVVTRRGVEPRPWVFVVDGWRSDAERFAVPRPIATRRWVMASITWDPLPPNERDEPEDGIADLIEGPGARSSNSIDDCAPVEVPPAAAASRQEAERSVEVRVIGPLEVVGWHDPGERATQLADLFCYLVLHRDYPVRGAALRMALRPDAADEIREETLHAYVSKLRRCVGAEVLPTATRDGYRVTGGATSDWERFRALTGPGASRSELEAALRLVRGRPFAGVPEGSFHWVDAELLVSQIDAAVADAAKRLAVACKEAGDAKGAAWAVRRGLLGSPYDAELWRLHLSFAAAHGPAALSRARKEAAAALGDDAML